MDALAAAAAENAFGAGQAALALVGEPANELMPVSASEAEDGPELGPARDLVWQTDVWAGVEPVVALADAVERMILVWKCRRSTDQEVNRQDPDKEGYQQGHQSIADADEGQCGVDFYLDPLEV